MSEMFKIAVAVAMLFSVALEARAGSYAPRPDYGYPAGLIPDCEYLSYAYFTLPCTELTALIAEWLSGVMTRQTHCGQHVAGSIPA